MYFVPGSFSYAQYVTIPAFPINLKLASDPLVRGPLRDRYFYSILSMHEVFLSELLLFINGLAVKER
jgi:hypothetical protein